MSPRLLRARLFTNLRRRRRLNGHAALQTGTQAAVAIVDLGPNAELPVHGIHFGADIDNAAAELAVGLARQVDRQYDRAARRSPPTSCEFRNASTRSRSVRTIRITTSPGCTHSPRRRLICTTTPTSGLWISQRLRLYLAMSKGVAFQIGGQAGDVAVFCGLLGFERGPFLCEPQFVEPRFATRSC